LGDFQEPDITFPVLPDNEKKNLVHKCLVLLEKIYKENDYGKVLVTSDSASFLEEAKRLDFVYVIPGKISHIDSRHTDYKTHLKLFLDYFMLSFSKKIYLVVEDGMYMSGFSYRVALHNNIPFIAITPNEQVR
jgi:hypothetical protein